MDEEALITAAKQGDLDAFNRLVLIYQNLAFNLAYRMLNDIQRAEDITQDSFISAYHKIHQFRGGSFRAWMMRIVTNACYDDIRRNKRNKIVSLTPFEDDQEEAEFSSWFIDDANNPEEALIRSDLIAVLQKCLNRLSPDFRSVIILVDIHGFDYAEAAAALKKPIGTVKSRLSRARVRMQRCLDGFREHIPAMFRFDKERHV